MRKDIAFGGVTRVPGGAVSSDGDLCAAVDVCNDGMGLEMLEKPTLLFELSQGEELLCIHEPEGEEHKHYITQWEVAGDQIDSGGGDDAPSPTGTTHSINDPVIDDEPYVEPQPYNPPDPEETYVDPQPYTPPQAADENVVTAYESCEGEEAVTDDGGTPGQTTTAGHIYLCWWVEQNGEYTRQQMIDITPYGKITAIEPMGNTLICNHAGGSNYPEEIRYYLWKGQDLVYIGLGAKPPFIDITFGLESTFEYYPKTASTFKNSGEETEYRKYGGVTISSYPYTDTVSVWWAGKESQSYVPPYFFYMDGTWGGHDDVFDHWQSTYSIEGVESPDGKTDVAGMKNNWTLMALGAYNKFIYDQNKENKFVFPFYVRYAYQLYDGSLIMHSYPVLMIPNSRGPIFALDGKKGLKADVDDYQETYEKVRLEFRGRVYGFSSKLMYDLKQLAADNFARLENWKDLIRSLNIYVTPPIYNYKQGGQVLGWKCMDWRDPANNDEYAWNKYYTVGKVKYKDETQTPAGDLTMSGLVGMDNMFVNNLLANGKTEIFWPWTYKDEDQQTVPCPVPDYILDIPQKEMTDIIELHENAGQFYKLAEIPYEKLIEMADPTQTEQGEQEVPAKKRILPTIANQDVMQDDNKSHDTLSAQVLYGYNRRLNMAQVSRIMHSPLKPSVVWPKDYAEEEAVQNVTSEITYPYHITINAHNGSKIAQLKCTDSAVNNGYPQYLFYPNPDAYEAIVTRGLNKYRLPLKEHKALNGAFWLADFLNKQDDFGSHQLVGPMTSAQLEEYLEQPEVNKIVDESNKIYTSETDNPFYVPFGNINIAGGGDVRALAAATQAMSQGQFGQHPCYCFTSEGVWAMTVGDTGGWATIQPVTRDVISAGTMPLSLDSTVVFLTERGLLQLAGAQIKVLSDVLQGADPLLLDTPNFGLHRLDDLCGASATDTGSLLNVATSLAVSKFPEQAWLAYDYDNARIYVTPQNGGGSWVYNLKSQIWTQASTALDRQIVSYPECEAQCGGKVVRISVDRAVLGNLCTKGLVLSRPIKLADMGLLKRWRELAVRGRFKPYSTAVQVALWGTRDWIDHALVASSTRNRLTRWSGSPYFGHSVALFLTKPDYAMQVAGMDIEVDAEHDNKLR